MTTVAPNPVIRKPKSGIGVRRKREGKQANAPKILRPAMMAMLKGTLRPAITMPADVPV